MRRADLKIVLGQAAWATLLAGAASFAGVDPVASGIVAATGICVLGGAAPGRKSDLIEPVLLTSVYLVVAYPLRLLSLEAELPGAVGQYPGLLANDAVATRTIWITVVGLWAYYLGYFVSLPGVERWLARLDIPFTGSRPRSSNPDGALLVIGIGFAVLAFELATGMWTGGPGTQTGANWSAQSAQESHLILVLLEDYIWLGFIGLVLWLLERRRGDRPILRAGALAAVGGTLLYSLALGSKRWLMFPVLWIGAVAYLNGRRRLMKWLGPVVVGVAVVSFLVVPAWRTLYSTRAQGTVSITRNIQIGFDAFRAGLQDPPDEALLLAPIVNRFNGIDNVAQVQQKVPDRVDYRYFSGLLQLPFSLVPRFLWADKPITARRNMNVYTIQVAEMTAGGTAASHPIGEGYFNAGLFGVAVIPWLWGLMQRLLYSGFYVPRKTSYVVAVLYLFFWLRFVGFGGWILQKVVTLPSTVVVYLPAVVLLSWWNGTSDDKSEFRATEVERS